jgi:hypothetical protein
VHSCAALTIAVWGKGDPGSIVHDGVIAQKAEEGEEGLFKADAVNEEDPERDHATQV